MDVTLPRVLLTGAHGFIGSHLLRHFIDAGYNVDAPNRAKLDLEDAAATAAYLARSRPQLVVHLASPAMAHAATSGLDVIAREVAVARALIEATPRGARFVHAGSMAEYGRSGRLAEGDDCAPITGYGRAKQAAAHQVRARADAARIDATTVRIFGAYGAGESLKRLFPQLLAQVDTGDPIRLSDGLQRRDFVHVADICRTIIDLTALPHPFAPIYNIGTGIAIEVRTAVERIATEAGICPDRLQFGAIERSPLDEACLEADTTLLSETLGWVPPQRFIEPTPLLPLLRK